MVFKWLWIVSREERSLRSVSWFAEDDFKESIIKVEKSYYQKVKLSSYDRKPPEGKRISV